MRSKRITFLLIALIVFLAGNLTPVQNDIVYAKDNHIEPTAQDVYAGDYVKIKSALFPNSCLTQLGTSVNGRNIGLLPCHQSGDRHERQKWQLSTPSRLGVIRIHSYKNPNKCADLKYWSQQNGDNVHLWGCHNAKSQQWYAEPMGQNFRFHSELNYNQCMDLKYWSASDNVHTWRCHGSLSQRWYFSK